MEEPHPWLADAPGEFVRLIDRGNVKIKVDDKRIRQANKAALTSFRFIVDYDFRFRYQWIESNRNENLWRAKIMAWMDQPKIRLEHTIFVPSTFTPTIPWQSNLLKHEFDHVAISTDPRLEKILKRVLQRRRVWVAEWDQATMPTENDLRAKIKDDLTFETKSFEKMIQSQYDQLDRESVDGLQDISDRQKFFLDLYTVAGLERTAFEYLDPVRDYLNDKSTDTRSRKDVDLHYLFLSK